jgi:iron complex transport system substrate-binding protein
MHFDVLHPSFRTDARGFQCAARPAKQPMARVASVLLVVVLVLVAGCSAPAASVVPSADTPSVSATQSTTSRSDFPNTVTDDEGTAVAIERRPERIVSLTPGTTEILFAIGAGDRVVATTDADDYPPQAVPLTDVGSFGSVDVERIVSLEADLVIAGGNAYTPPDAIGTMRSVGIPVVVVYAPSVAGVLADVELIGQAVGQRKEALQLATEMRTEIDALTDAVEDLPRPRVFYEVDASAAVFGPADDSFLAEMVSLAGGDPITSGSATSFEIPLENLVAADPEVIVLGDAAFGATPEQVAARPAWDVMTAVQTGAVRVADDKVITRPGPRLPQGLRSLILAIHPDARLP